MGHDGKITQIKKITIYPNGVSDESPMPVVILEVPDTVRITISDALPPADLVGIFRALAKYNWDSV